MATAANPGPPDGNRDHRPARPGQRSRGPPRAGAFRRADASPEVPTGRPGVRSREADSVKWRGRARPEHNLRPDGRAAKEKTVGRANYATFIAEGH